MNKLEIKNLFDLNNTILKDYLLNFKYPYEVFDDLENYILKLGNSLSNEYKKINDNIWIHESAKIDDRAKIIGPTIISKNAEIRFNAYIRGSVVIGEDCVVGNSSEVKNSILFNKAKAPHFNYVGDSILGYNVNLGAGSVLSNLRFDKQLINIKYNNLIIPTKRKKLGSILADNVEVGCNSVLNPGTIVLKNSYIKPLSNVNCVVVEDSYYTNGNIIKKR